MADKTTLSKLQIASKLKAGKSFRVDDDKQRKQVLVGAKYLGVVVKTVKADDDKYDVLFCKP